MALVSTITVYFRVNFDFLEEKQSHCMGRVDTLSSFHLKVRAEAASEVVKVNGTNICLSMLPWSWSGIKLLLRLRQEAEFLSFPKLNKIIPRRFAVSVDEVSMIVVNKYINTKTDLSRQHT